MRGTLAGRALIAVGMLAGFYVVALAVIAGLVAAIVVVLGNVGSGMAGIAGKVVLVLFAAAGAVMLGLLKALRPVKFEPHGIRLTEAEQPRLWALVRDLSNRVVTRPPDEIYLVAEVNAGVTERGSMLGLRSGKRYLFIGLPLLVMLDVDQLSSVLAHELGHYSRAHSRLAPINYRGTRTIQATLVQLQGDGIVRGLVRWILARYASLYFLVSHAVSRRQEYEADQAAGAIAGRRATQSALREIPVLEAAWGFYLERYVSIGLDHGFAPQEVFGAFPQFVRARTSDLQALRENAPDEQTSKWDTHPAIPERVAALETAPDHPKPPDARPATVLVDRLEVVVPALELETLDLADRTPLPWPEYVARSIHAQWRGAANAYYRALSRSTGRTPESLATVVAEPGRLEESREGVEAAVTTALLEAGAARVALRWDGPWQLVDRDGKELNVVAILAAIQAGRGAETLRALGVEPARSTGLETMATARTARIIGALSPVSLDKRLTDLYITDEGMVFVPIDGVFKKRRPDGRLRRTVEGSTAQELVDGPANTWIPYEEIARSVRTKRLAIGADLTLHNGRTLRMKAPIDVRGLPESEDLMRTLLDRFARGE